jgi:hypothetical protein
VDFPHVEDVTIEPGETYFYEQGRAFNIVDDGYLMQALTVEEGGIYRHHSSIEAFEVLPGVEVVSPLTITPTMPLVAEPVTATYSIQNQGNTTITLPGLGIIARGPNCSDWNCEGGWNDFPVVEDITITPGQVYTYSQQRPFWEVGENYFADAAFADNNPWWYEVPNNQRVTFDVLPALEMDSPLTLSSQEALVGEVITASFDITNVSSRTLSLERILLGVHGPYCTSWDCPNAVDFPHVENVTLNPGESYHYERQRAFRIADEGYFLQVLTVEEGGIWRHHSPVEPFSVLPGIEVVEPLVLTPTTPLVSEPVTATYAIWNQGSRDITLPQLGIISRGPNCTEWDCEGGWNDFPVVHSISIQAGETYTYQEQRSFWEVGKGYFADIAFGDNNNWWYEIPNNQRVDFEVSDGMDRRVYLPLVQRQ